MWDESIERQHNEEREQDREARDTQRYEHDEHTPTTHEQADPLLPKMMGAAYAHYFHEDEEIANVEDEVQANYEHDDKYGLI